MLRCTYRTRCARQLRQGEPTLPPGQAFDPILPQSLSGLCQGSRRRLPRGGARPAQRQGAPAERHSSVPPRPLPVGPGGLLGERTRATAAMRQRKFPSLAAVSAALPARASTYAAHSPTRTHSAYLRAANDKMHSQPHLRNSNSKGRRAITPPCGCDLPPAPPSPINPPRPPWPSSRAPPPSSSGCASATPSSPTPAGTCRCVMDTKTLGVSSPRVIVLHSLEAICVSFAGGGSARAG